MHIFDRVLILALLLLAPALSCYGSDEMKYRILVVDSYHSDYKWSQDTHKGLLSALEDAGLISSEEKNILIKENELNGHRIYFKRLWMDTKRNKGKEHINNVILSFSKEINEYSPSIIFLGDDNAVDGFGYAYLDKDVPIVFWGVNGKPDRYDFFNSLEEPGHNITGVYQSMFQIETAQFLQKLNPDIRTMAVIGDDSKTSRARVAQIKSAELSGSWPIQIKKYFLTNDYEYWQQRVTEISKEVESFFVINVNAMKDKNGRYVPQDEVLGWYLDNVKIPEAAALDLHVKDGLLCNVEDSGFSQGFEAGKIGIRILFGDTSPAKTPVITPNPGAKIINKGRAGNLGIQWEQGDVDKVVE